MDYKKSTNYKFERIEKKFWMTKGQYENLLPVFNSYLKGDEYSLSEVRNIYYDTPDYALIRRSIERPLFKEKLRIRSYGDFSDDSKVFIEIKRKLNGIGYKRRVKLPFFMAKELLSGKKPPDIPDSKGDYGGVNLQIESEILEFVSRYKPKPMVNLAYKRMAFAGREDPGLRVTIDKDLMYRTEDVFSGESGKMNPVMDEDSMVLMEIKSQGAIPRWLTDEMSRLEIYQAPFSKIGSCYLRHIARGQKPY